MKPTKTVHTETGTEGGKSGGKGEKRTGLQENHADGKETDGKGEDRTYQKITDEIMGEICSLLEKGLTARQACLYHNVSVKTFHQIAAKGSAEHFKAGGIHEHWRGRIARARVHAVVHWLDRLEDAALTNAAVRAAELMLGALDPERFKDRKDSAGGITVNIIQGGTCQRCGERLSGPGVYSREIPASAMDPDHPDAIPGRQPGSVSLMLPGAPPGVEDVVPNGLGLKVVHVEPEE